ncbi:MAG: DUF2723 domain-containing protein [Verrucomicrobia bacterium]|nr:DUF2723 domain-containing protein [Verrucomicrobiota bacterium]
MEQPPSSPRNFTQSVLPWIVAASALVLYLATLASWVTLPSLNLTAQVLGWDWWNPKIGRPLYHLLTLPVKGLPAGVQLFALNAFAAVCSALTLALLARSVALLPQDRTHDQRARLRDETGLLAVRGNWLPPLLAVLGCGLQLSFWEHATAATGEALDLLLFAVASWCLLEFRIGRDDKWLARFALACGLGFANNWAMVGFAPFLLVALVWVKGREFFNLRFLGRLAAWGVPGLLLYLFNPLTASPEFGFSFSDLLTAELGAQKNNLLYNPRGRVLLLSFATVLPLTLIGIRWSSGFGDVSAAGAWLSGFMLRFVHAGFLGVSVYLTLDQAFSPRALGEGRAMLLFYYLGALVIGYCAGYFLLLCGTDEEKAWRKPGPLGKAFNTALIGVLWVGLLALPGWLVVKNLASIHQRNGDMAKWFAGELAKELPGQGAVALSEQPTHLLLVAAHFHGQASPHLLLDARMLQLTRYHRQLAKRHVGRWPDPGATPDTQVIPPIAIASFLGMQSRSNHVMLLHPPLPAMYLENLWPEPHGLVNELKLYGTNDIVPPRLSAPLAVSLTEWWRKSLHALEYIPEVDWAGGKLFDQQQMAGFLSASANHHGVELLRAGSVSNALHLFEVVIKVNRSNLVAVLNRDFHESLRTGKPSASDPAKIAQELLGPGQTWGSVLAKHGPPDEPNFCFALGQLLRQSGMPRQAIIQFTRVTELAPTNVAAHLALADTFIALGQPDRAKAALDHARAKPELRAGLAAQEATLLRFDALYLSQTGKKAEAEQALVEALKNGHFGLAEIAWQRKQTTDAKKHYEAGLKLASTNAPEAKLAQQRLKELSGGK